MASFARAGPSRAKDLNTAGIVEAQRRPSDLSQPRTVTGQRQEAGRNKAKHAAMRLAAKVTPMESDWGVPLTAWATAFLLLSIALIVGRRIGLLPGEIRVDGPVHAVERLLGERLGGALIGAAGRWQGVVDGKGKQLQISSWALSFYKTSAMMAGAAILMAAANTATLATLLPRGRVADERIRTGYLMSIMLVAMGLTHIATSSYGGYDVLLTFGGRKAHRVVPLSLLLRYLMQLPGLDSLTQEVLVAHERVILMPPGQGYTAKDAGKTVRGRSGGFWSRFWAGPYLHESGFHVLGHVIGIFIMILLGWFIPFVGLAGAAIWMVFGFDRWVESYYCRPYGAGDCTSTECRVRALGLTPQPRQKRDKDRRGAGASASAGTASSSAAAMDEVQVTSVIDSAEKTLCRFRRSGAVFIACGVFFETLVGVGPTPDFRAVAAGLNFMFEAMCVILIPAVYVQFRALALTDVAALEQRLAAAQTKAAAEQEANEARRRFLRYVMHEARVPANAIRLGLDSLAQGEALSEDDRETVDMMRQAAENQAGIFNSVLSLAAMESDSFTLNRCPTNLPEMLNQCSRCMMAWAASLGALLSVELGPDVPRDVLMDKARIGQVVTNFVSNALKAVPAHGAGRVNVTARYVQSGMSRTFSGQSLSSGGSTITRSSAGNGYGTARGYVRVEVTDNGPGIPQAEQAKLFQPYVQIAGSNKTIQGTGLGLTIARHIVEAHGGRIGFHSTEGLGSTFWFELPAPVPRRPGHSPTLPLAAGQTATSAGQGTGERDRRPGVDEAVPGLNSDSGSTMQSFPSDHSGSRPESPPSPAERSSNSSPVADAVGMARPARPDGGALEPRRDLPVVGGHPSLLTQLCNTAPNVLNTPSRSGTHSRRSGSQSQSQSRSSPGVDVKPLVPQDGRLGASAADAGGVGHAAVPKAKRRHVSRGSGLNTPPMPMPDAEPRWSSPTPNVVLPGAQLATASPLPMSLGLGTGVSGDGPPVVLAVAGAAGTGLGPGMAPVYSHSPLADAVLTAAAVSGAPAAIQPAPMAAGGLAPAQVQTQAQRSTLGQPAGLQAAAPAQTLFEGLRFLVVDDVPSNRKMLIRVLQAQAKKQGSWASDRHGVPCPVSFVEAVNGQEGVDIMRAAGPSKPFHVVFMDAAMPVMDGYDATRVMRQDLGYRHLLMGITGNALDVDQDSFRDAGADLVLTKPIDSATLVRILRERAKPIVEAQAGLAGQGLPTGQAQAGLPSAAGQVASSTGPTSGAQPSSAGQTSSGGQQSSVGQTSSSGGQASVSTSAGSTPAGQPSSQSDLSGQGGPGSAISQPIGPQTSVPAQQQRLQSKPYQAPSAGHEVASSSPGLSRHGREAPTIRPAGLHGATGAPAEAVSYLPTALMSVESGDEADGRRQAFERATTRTYESDSPDHSRHGQQASAGSSSQMSKQVTPAVAPPAFIPLSSSIGQAAGEPTAESMVPGGYDGSGDLGHGSTSGPGMGHGSPDSVDSMDKFGISRSLPQLGTPPAAPVSSKGSLSLATSRSGQGSTLTQAGQGSMGRSRATAGVTPVHGQQFSSQHTAMPSAGSGSGSDEGMGRSGSSA